MNEQRELAGKDKNKVNVQNFLNGARHLVTSSFYRQLFRMVCTHSQDKHSLFCVKWNLLTVSSFSELSENFYNKPGQALSLTVYIYSVTLKVSPKH